MLKKSELFERICDLEMQVENLEETVWELLEKSKPKKKTKK